MNLSLKSKDFIKYSKEEVVLILKEYIKEQKEVSYRKMLDDDNFKKSSRSEYQAFQLGFQKALTKLDLFIPDQEGI